jgi:hypothetical protein
VNNALKKFRCEIQSLEAAKPRSDDDHRVDCAVERFDIWRAVAIEGAERTRMIFGDSATPAPGRDAAKAHVE